MTFGKEPYAGTRLLLYLDVLEVVLMLTSRSVSKCLRRN